MLKSWLFLFIALADLCPNAWSGLIPDPESCGRFYQCSNGYPYVFDCPANLHFNPVLLVCDWPENAGCVVTSTSPPPSSTTEEETTKPPTTEAPPPPSTTEEQTTEPPTETPPPPSTTEAPPETTFLPEETTIPIDFEEPEVTTLLPELTTTEDPEDVVPTTLSPLELGEEPESSGDGQEGSGQEPQYEGSDGEPLVKCPAGNHGADIFLPDPRDCNGFYYCSWGTAIPQHCPVGLHWSVRLSVCTYPSEAACTF